MDIYKKRKTGINLEWLAPLKIILLVRNSSMYFFYIKVIYLIINS